MAYGTVNADVLQSSVSGVSLGAGNASIMKNRIINGDMRIDQRNAGASVTPSADGYLLDRWSYFASQASKITFQQNKGTVAPPVGFSNYFGMSVASAVSGGSSDYFLLQHPIEGFNTADLNWGSVNAKTVTLSFWVYSSLTGQFGGALANSGFSRGYPFSYTINAANTWEQKTITIVGDTSGTWLTNNGVGIYVVLDLGTGSTYLGTSGTWGSASVRGATGDTKLIATAGATFYITGVQLEVGSSATGFEYRMYGTELANCQRYYEKGSAGAGSRSGDNICYTYINYKQEKRAVPTFAGVSQTLNANYTDSVQCYQTGLGAANNSLFTWTSSAEL